MKWTVLSEMRKQAIRIGGQVARDTYAKMELVDIQNVADMFYGTDKEEWNDSDFFCIAPPWTSSWMEFVMTVKEAGQKDVKCPVAAHIIGVTIPRKERRTALQRDIVRVASERIHYPGSEKDISRVGKDWEKKVQSAIQTYGLPAWGMTIAIYFPFTKTRHNPYCVNVLYLDKSGKIMTDVTRFLTTESSVRFINAYYSGLTPEEVMSSMSMPFLYALQFLNCKNVEVVQTRANRVNRRKAKRDGVPDFVYRQLVVRRMRKEYPQDAREQAGDPEARRLHICRGHFKDYTEKGLFGKIKGIFWWEAQVRGHLEKGIVDKDYILVE